MARAAKAHAALPRDSGTMCKGSLCSHLPCSRLVTPNIAHLVPTSEAAAGKVVPEEIDVGAELEQGLLPEPLCKRGER